MLASLDTITVFATRSPTESFDYPGQVSVIDRDAILDFNPSSLGDIFAAIPGARFDSGPRRTGDAPTIRGLSGSGVLIFIDGARQSFVSGHDGRFFIDPELVQAVEVVRGPASALYGSGALGGVIAARTVTAADMLEDDERFAIRLNAGYQSVNDETRAGATGGWRSAGGALDVVGHLTWRASGDIALGSGDDLPADDEILSSLLKVTAKPAPDLELFASWIRFGADATDPNNPQGVNVAAPDNALVFRDIASNTVQGGVTWNPASPLLDVRLVAYVTETNVGEDETESPRTIARDVETFGVTLDNRSTVTLSDRASIVLTYGGEYFRDRQTGTDNATSDGTRGGVPDATTEFWGAFAQAEITLEDSGPLPGRLSLIPGVRWDSFRSSEPGGTFSIDESRVTPKVGVSWAPIRELLIFGNYAEGFRAPSFNEAFADGAHFVIPDLSAPPGPGGPRFVTNLFLGNPDIRPEVSSTWEVGAGADLDDFIAAGDRLLLKGSFYRSSVDDLIGLDVNIPGGCFSPALAFIAPCGSGPAFNNVSRNVNIADARIEGVELEFSYETRQLWLHGNFATIDGVDRATGEFLEGVLAADTLFVDGGLRFFEGAARLGARATWGGRFTDVNDPLQARDNFTVADIYAVLEPRLAGLEGVRLDLGVDNVADADYEVVAAGVSQPGRNFKVALSWRRGF